MSYKELINALNKGCEEKICSVWNDAEAEAGRIMGGLKDKISELTEKYGKMNSAAVREKEGAIFSEAKKRARDIRLTSEGALSAALYKTAKQLLSELRNEQYDKLFAAIFKELPSNKWKTVKVNPEDAALAGTYIPGTEIIPDIAISGGLEVVDESGDIRIVNTFEKRLEILWPEMLPELIKDIYKRVEVYGTSSE